MQLLPYFLAGLIIYSISALLPIAHYKHIISTNSYYILGCVLASIGIVAWLTIARSIPASELSKYGLLWDIMLTMCYVIAPALIIKQNLNLTNVAGIAIIFVGIVFLKA